MKKDILKTILIIWIFAATSYMAWDLWNDYKIKGIQAAYQQGKNEIASQLIEQAQQGDCRSIEVQSEGKTTNLVSADCLSEQTGPSSN